YEDCTAPVIASKVQDICISTGGTDPIGLSKALMEYLLGDAKQAFEASQIRFHFLIGSGNPDRDELIRMAGEESNLYTYYDLPEVRSLFTKCDLILSAAGSTLYEICALGIPCITYALADNQLQGERAFEEEGLMRSLGDVRGDENVARNAFESLIELANDPAKRAEMSKKMRMVVDGKGSKSAVFDMMRADLC
ncbi:MAG: hypothetical protein J5546_11280, partial [Lachnospiraceae bacterium]|nr:hypothetical protein [Lachnospiraceae bacterium]